MKITIERKSFIGALAIGSQMAAKAKGLSILDNVKMMFKDNLATISSYDSEVAITKRVNVLEMESELKFNSQVCTDINQSKKLLEMGLKPETADMYIFDDEVYIGKPNIDDIPAWSLHRLIEMCGIDRMPISFHKKGKIRIRVNHIHPTHEGRSGYNHYNSLIDCIEWLIYSEHFNKKYLKEK